jgi:hypothetical protein
MSARLASRREVGHYGPRIDIQSLHISLRTAISTTLCTVVSTGVVDDSVYPAVEMTLNLGSFLSMQYAPSADITHWYKCAYR